MARIKEIGFIDILNELPDIVPLNCEKDFSEENYDIFFCALGFEDRCLTIPEQLAKVDGFKCKQALIFEYPTNIEDNEVNKYGLIEAIRKFTDAMQTLQCDEENFAKKLREYLNIVIPQNTSKIIFDISACSSKLLLSVMKVLLEYDVYLHIVYSEAAIYHPTWEEFKKEPEKWTTEEHFGIARGVGKVTPSPEYPGSTKENPNLIIAFLTFKPERTMAIIADIDETLLIQHDKRIIWIVGNPHMDEETRKKRKKIMKAINKIPKECPTYEVCTFNYKETLKILDKIYNDKYLFHINISALGSKMQTLGITIFYYVRSDVSVYLAIPEKYNPRQYSEDAKATWQIDFGDTGNIRNILDKVGQLEVING